MLQFTWGKWLRKVFTRKGRQPVARKSPNKSIHLRFEALETRLVPAVLFNDLTATTGGSETATGQTWFTGEFTTDGSAHSALTATLLMGQSSAGTPTLDLYDDGGLQPGNLVATFTNPASISTTLASNAFTLSNVSLDANTKYWLVLHASSGAFDWAWTSDTSVINGWGESFDGGASWFAADTFPLQYSVTTPGVVTITTSADLAGATVGAVYQQTLAATGTAPFTWSVTSGALPPGLALSSAGIVSGTPTQAGSFNFTAQAANSSGDSASQAFALTVAAAPVNTVGPSGFIATLTPTFTWPAVTAASSYSVWLTDRTTGQSQQQALTMRSWTPPSALAMGHDYTWWYGAIFAGGSVSWSAGYDFRTAPAASGPSGTVATTTPTISWTSVAGASGYQVWVTDQTTGQNIVANVTGTSWTPTTPFVIGHTYVWWVGATASNGAIGWNDAEYFTIGATASGPSGTVTSIAPTFSWSGVTGATSYQVWLTDQTTGRNNVVNVSGTTWTPTFGLAMGHNYVWWVGAVGPGGGIGWNDAEYFTVGVTMNGPSGTVNTTTPAFTWTGIGAASYQVWLTDQSTGQNTIANVSGTNWTSPSAFTLGDSYVWWVGAVGSDGSVAWSDAEYFTIGAPASGPSGSVATTRPAFSWGAVAGASAYQVWLTDQTSGGNTVTTVTGTSWTPTTALLLGHQYAWWVGTVRANGAVAWNDVTYFSIAPTASGPSGTVHSTTPTFTWNSVTGVSSYQVWVTDQTTGENTIVNVSGTSWAPAGLWMGHRYEWWVAAVGTDGSMGWSEATEFTIA